jgi:hypothetical protein
MGLSHGVLPLHAKMVNHVYLFISDKTQEISKNRYNKNICVKVTKYIEVISTQNVKHTC